MDVLDVIRDESGERYLCLTPAAPGGTQVFDWIGNDDSVLSSYLLNRRQLACFDGRELVRSGQEPELLVDLSLLRDLPLVRLAAEYSARSPALREAALLFSPEEDFLEFVRKTLVTSKVDLDRCSLLRSCAGSRLKKFMSLRGKLLCELAKALYPYEVDGLRRTARVFPAIVRMEERGVCVYQSAARAALEAGRVELAHDARFFRQCAEGPGGFLWPRYRFRATSTGRMKVSSGPNVMGIPHGICRDLVVSRFSGGRIVSMDFNAIDYRSLVVQVPELRERYAGAADFHERTRELAFLKDLSREQVKYLTYVHVYGGTPETVAAKTGLPADQVRLALQNVDRLLRDLTDFSRELHHRAKYGQLLTPEGSRVPATPSDSVGKVTGLYAQSCASEAFERALMALDGSIRQYNYRTVIAFPVHDELVLDVPKEELHLLDFFRGQMEAGAGPGHFVKVRVGKNYREATE